MLAERSLPPEAWCEVVGALELGLNTAVSDSTGKPPALVALGEMPRLPVDLIVGTESHVGAQNVATQVKVIVEEARKQLAKAQEYQKRYYDAHHRQQDFEAGQLVLLSTKNLRLPGTRKLHPRWVGPFKVVQKIGAAAYKLDLQGRFQ